mgnify:CR=1 FL=1
MICKIRKWAMTDAADLAEAGLRGLSLPRALSTGSGLKRWSGPALCPKGWMPGGAVGGIVPGAGGIHRAAVEDDGAVGVDAAVAAAPSTPKCP